jgi:hypothetical protein
MAAPTGQATCVPMKRCVRCHCLSKRTADKCHECGCVAFVQGHPLTWWPVRFEGEEARFLFPKFDAAAPRLDLDYGPKPLRKSASRSRSPRAMRAL